MLLLRAPSACHTHQLQRSHNMSHDARPPPPRSASSSSCSSAHSSYESIFDADSHSGTPLSHRYPYEEDYFTDDTDFDDEPAALDLSDSGFTSVPVPLFAESDCLLSVYSLDLSQNPMDGTSEEYLAENIHLPNLESLRLQSCHMSSLEPLMRHLRAPNLKELDISDHCLDGPVPHLQRFFPKLHTLIARGGRFEHLDEAAVAGLAFVDLSDNLLGAADDQLMERCHELGTRLVL